MLGFKTTSPVTGREYAVATGTEDGDVWHVVMRDDTPQGGHCVGHGATVAEALEAMFRADGLVALGIEPEDVTGQS